MSRTVTAKNEDGFRPDIEGLRGIAVLLVVLFHAGLLSASDVQLRGGFIGVDVFFVVSGFLITGLLIRERERNGGISFSKFYARRVRRILPAAAVVLLVTLPAAYGIVTLVDRSSVMQDGASAALSVANVRFAVTTDYFNPVSYSPFLHFWSLGVEEQFYFVWPAILAVFAWRWPRVGAAVALTAIVVGSFALSLVVTDANPSMAFYMLPTRAWQLAAGGLLAVGVGSLARAPRFLRETVGAFLTFAGWLALAALLFAAVTLDSASVPYPGLAALFPTVAGVVLIASGMERAGPGVLLRLWPVRFLGKISYSLYLWHWPMLILGGTYLAGSLRTSEPGAAPLTMTQALAIVGLSIVVSALSWALVEEPFRRGRIPLPSRPSRTVAIGVTVMLIVATVGGSLDFSAERALAGVGSPNDVAQVDPIASEEPSAEPIESPSPDPTGRPSQVTPTPAPRSTPTRSAAPPVAPVPTPKPPTQFALTSAIHPSLAGVRKDLERPWNERCLGWTNTTVPRNCVYGNPNGKVTIALVGDSHASALFPAVEAMAKQRGWRLVVFLKIACSFLDMPITNPELKREYTECATWNANVIGKVNALRPNLTLVTESRWIYPLNDADDTVAREGAAYGREIAKLAGKVAIIQDTPLPGDDVPDCLSAHLDDFRQCAVPRWRALGSQLGQREQIASQATGAPILDINAYICPGTGACPVVINNMIVYRDGHHLTATYSATLGPALDQKLKLARLP